VHTRLSLQQTHHQHYEGHGQRQHGDAHRIIARVMEESGLTGEA
jgi:hypothetical protein